MQEREPPLSEKQILQKLHLNSCKLISGEGFNLESLGKTCSIHRMILEQMMGQLQSILTKKVILKTQNVIDLDSIVNKWSNRQISESRALGYIGKGQIVQILGRINGGKSYLIHEMIVECLKQGKKVIFLDSTNSETKIMYKVIQQIEKETKIQDYRQNLKIIKFQTLGDLSIILHCIGQTIVNQQWWIFIDNLNRIEQSQSQSNNVNSLQYKLGQKLHRLFYCISQNIGTIVYVSRGLNANNLFNNIYKHQKHRPKNIGQSSKQFDAIASKTICVDYCRTRGDEIEHWWINLSKSINNTVHKFSRKI